MEKLKAERIFLSIAGKTIEFYFEPSEQVFYKRKLIETIGEIWGREGYLLKKGKKADFTIEFIPEAGKSEVLVRKLDQKFFFLIARKNFQKRKISLYYSEIGRAHV